MEESRSIYGELQSTFEYSELADEALFERALYFTQLEQSSEITPRAKKDVQTILGRLTFEMVARDNIFVVEK